jgi:hypothetical protein
MTTRVKNAMDFVEKVFLAQGLEDVYKHTLEVTRNLQDTIEVLVCAALLHDVVEDTDVTLADIRVAFGRDVADTVDALTRREGEDYQSCYIYRVRANPLARIIKLKGDIPHNISRPRVEGWSNARMQDLRHRYSAAAEGLQW